MTGYDIAAVEQPAAAYDEVLPVSPFTATQVCTLARCTYRQLDWWARTDVLVPSIAEAKGQGSQRLYSADDVRAARVCMALSQLGTKGSVLTEVAAVVRDLGPSVTHLAVTADLRVMPARDARLPDGVDAAWMLDLVALGAHRHAAMQLAADLVGVT